MTRGKMLKSALAVALMAGIFTGIVVLTEKGGDGSPVNGIITVKKDGTGDFKRIQEAIAFSEANEIIEVCDSETYTEHIDLANYPNRTLRTASGCKPTVEGTIWMGNGCVAKGLLIKMIDLSAEYSVRGSGKSNWTLSGCEITQEVVKPLKITLSAVNVNGGSNIKILSNIIRDCYGQAMYIQGGAENILVQGNIVCQCRGIRLSSSYGTTNVQLISNTLYDNSYSGIYGSIGSVASVIKNNIIVGNTYGLINSGSSVGSDVIDYNDVWGNDTNYSGNGVSAGAHDISVDPLFADAAGDDFHIKSTAGRWTGSAWVNDAADSPCIDTGDPASDCSKEPNGPRINMGGYGNTHYASKTTGDVNDAPTSPVVSVTPLNPDPDSDDITCNIDTASTDPDGDPITYSYAWYKNGQLQSGLTTNTVSHSNLGDGDWWECEVTASDGLLDSPATEAGARCTGDPGRPDYATLRATYCWIQDAIDALPAEGGTVTIPAGTHEIYTTIRIDHRTNITVKGAGPGSTTLTPHTSGINIFGSRVAESAKIQDMELGGGTKWYEVSDSEISNIKIDVRTSITGSACQRCLVKDNDLNQAHIIFFSSEYMEILDNTIRGAYWHAIDLNSGNRHWKVYRNKIYNCDGIHIYSGSNYNEICDNYLNNCEEGILITYQSRHNLIKGNVIEGTRDGTPGILIDRGHNSIEGNTITNNVIFNCSGDGILFNLYQTNPYSSSGENYIYNNVIFGCAGDGIDWTQAYHETSGLLNRAVIKNNIIVGNGGYGIKAHATNSGLTSSYNDIFDNTSGHYDNCSGTDDTHVDPLFADAAGNDFHLKSKAGRWDPDSETWVTDTVTSPCIDAGDPVDDYSNEPSPNGDRINQGAYGNTDKASKTESATSEVTSRYTFYNNSAFDGSSDDDAIAPEKTALLQGGTATFANYTSYSRGINGIMVDITNLPGTPTAADFTFKVGNDNNPAGWTAAPTPSCVTVREGAGVDGSDRITIIWTDNAIQKQWLQVTVKATTATGLASNDVFYFGNAIGETGNSATDATVKPTDEIGARNNPHTLGGNPAGIDDAYDFDRDRKVGPTDEIIARNNGTDSSTALQLITAP